MVFTSRQEAGQLLAQQLKDYKNQPETIVLAIPRGGVEVAAEVAKILNLPLDIIVTRKIGAPFQPELALGAVDPDGKVVWEEELKKELGIENKVLELEIKRQESEVKRREAIYRQGRPPLPVTGKKVVLVDDGIATGATALAAVKYLQRHQADQVIVAAPVTSRQAKNLLQRLADGVIVLEAPLDLTAIGAYYKNFQPVSDQEVIQLLHR